MPSRYEELLACWKKPYVPGDVDRKERCTIMDEKTTWEGFRSWEIVENGDAMLLSGGMRIPLSTQFLLCKDHETHN